MSLRIPWAAAFLLVFVLARSEAAVEGGGIVIPGSTWSGFGTVKSALRQRHLGRGEEVIDFDLALGPIAARGLAANRFSLVLDDGFSAVEITGSYSLDRTKATFTPDVAGLKRALCTFSLHPLGLPPEGFDRWRVTLETGSLTASFTSSARNGDSVKLKLKHNFLLALWAGILSVKDLVDGENVDGSVKYSATGTR